MLIIWIMCPRVNQLFRGPRLPAALPRTYQLKNKVSTSHEESHLATQTAPCRRLVFRDVEEARENSTTANQFCFYFATKRGHERLNPRTLSI